MLKDLNDVPTINVFISLLSAESQKTIVFHYTGSYYTYKIFHYGNITFA